MKIGLILVGVFGFGIVLFFVVWNRVSPQNNSSMNSPKSSVNWSYDYGRTNTWKVSGNPPACPDPLVIDSPVDVSLATSILYPGQIRGTDFKPHGGFRFDNRDTNDIEVRAIMDGYILKASRYDDGGEVQNFIFYVNDCGIMVMHDHLVTLSPKLQAVFDKLPINPGGDSRTTYIEPKVYIEKGEVMATEIGYKNFEGRKNIFVDFGLYDLRKTNGVNFDAAFRAKNPNISEYGNYAICWLDNLTEPSESIVKNLPAADGESGKNSDYCN